MNLDALLAPVPGESPCGTDLSFSVEFDAILEKRREDDPTLDQGEWKRALKVADWPGVITLCETLLATRTKDLRVAAWWTDASARIAGFGGLADGLALCDGICARYWDDLHPRPEGGDPAQRAGSLNWLLGQVAELSRTVPVIASGTRRHGLRDIDAARALQQAIARGTVEAATATAGGTPTPDALARLQASTPRAFFLANLADATRCLDALEGLQRRVDARMGADGPGFGPARQALEDAVATVARFARDGDATAPAGADDTALSGEAAASAPGPTGPTGPLQTRAQALRQLRAVAEFFRRTEPHSPVAYLADKAARWGEMPLHAWLRVVLKDPNALAHVEELLGVEPPAPADP